MGRSDIRFVIARHEQAAAHAADGYARATGKPGVLLVHVGPGMTNAVDRRAHRRAWTPCRWWRSAATSRPTTTDGIRTRRSTSTPTPTRPPSTGRSSSGPGRCIGWPTWPGSPSAPSGRRPPDAPARCCSACRWTTSRGRFRADTAAAYPLATQERPGLPADVAARIADLLVAAERPLVYLGGGLRRGPGLDALRRLVEHLDIPVAHSLMAKGTLPDSHPLLLGMPGFWGLELTNRYTREADVVLALATRFAETDASSWDRRYTWQFPPGRLIQIDIDPAEIGRNFPVDAGRGRRRHRRGRGDRRRRPRAGSRRRPRRAGLRETITSTRRTLFTESRERGTSDQFPLRPERILTDLRAILPADAVLVTDVGWNKNGVAQCYELPDDGRFITPGGASTMGFGPAAAVGVQIAQPDRTVVALIGDGGMSAQLPAVPMAVEQGAPVIFVVMNNRSHGTISDLQSANFGRSYGCDFLGPDGQPYSPDFAAYGRACGADGYAVDAAAGLGAALRAALAARRPAVLDVPWSTSLCRPLATGTSRTSTRASSNRRRQVTVCQTGCSSSTDPTSNMLGRREPDTYGRTTLAQIETRCREVAKELDFDMFFGQSNSEGTSSTGCTGHSTRRPRSSSTRPVCRPGRWRCTTRCGCSITAGHRGTPDQRLRPRVDLPQRTGHRARPRRVPRRVRRRRLRDGDPRAPGPPAKPARRAGRCRRLRQDRAQPRRRAARLCPASR